MSLRLQDGAVTVDVSGAFVDPSNGEYTFTATSSSEGVATVTVAGSVVTVTPVSPGVATVTVTARDEGGDTATQEFEVRVALRGVTVSTDALTVDEGSTNTYTVVLDSEPTVT